jgi:malate dehydrogenase
VCGCLSPRIDGNLGLVTDHRWKIVQGLEIDAKSAEKLRITAEELSEERELALECIAEAGKA